MRKRRISNVIGFDDAPFERSQRGPVALVGTVCSGTRLDIVVRGDVDRDGSNATPVMAQLVREKKLVHVRGVLLQGITVAGFNVVDINALAEELELPVLVVMRKKPRMQLFLDALDKVKDAEAKLEVLKRAGPIEACSGLWVHRAGLSLAEAQGRLDAAHLEFTIDGSVRSGEVVVDQNPPAGERVPLETTTVKLTFGKRS